MRIRSLFYVDNMTRSRRAQNDTDNVIRYIVGEENSDIQPESRGETSDKKIWWNSYAASSTTVAKKNSVLLSLEMTTTGSRGVSSSSSLLPEAVFVGSSIPGATRAAAPSAVSANLATEYPLRDLSQKLLEKPLHLSCTLLFFSGIRSHQH